MAICLCAYSSPLLLIYFIQSNFYPLVPTPVWPLSHFLFPLVTALCSLCLWVCFCFVIFICCFFPKIPYINDSEEYFSLYEYQIKSVYLTGRFLWKTNVLSTSGPQSLIIRSLCNLAAPFPCPQPLSGNTPTCRTHTHGSSLVWNSVLLGLRPLHQLFF